MISSPGSSVHALGLLFILALVCAGRVNGANPWGDRPHLEAATQAARWLESVQVKTEHGIAWPVAPDSVETIERNFYSGTPGVILFLLELHRATGEPLYLEEAKLGADDLLGWLESQDRIGDFGLHTGLAGCGFTLHEVFKTTRNERYLAGAQRCVDLIRQHAQTSPQKEGIAWNETTDIISGSAGIGLFLLYAAAEMDDAESLQLAFRAGDRLIQMALPVPLDDAEPGLKWFMDRDYPKLFPNFSHGTAGVCYFLTCLHQVQPDLEDRSPTGDQDRFLNAALAGARYLLSIADQSEGRCLIFHHEPGDEGLFYLGWCHGPVGTSRLFHRLAQVTGEESWMEWVHRGASTIMTSGIPETRTDGFWNNAGACCGSAGVASFFLSLHETTGRPEYLDFARKMNGDIMSRATRVELEDGRIALKWIHAEHRIQPDLLQAQTGYMQGAAGIGLWLLQLDAHETGRPFGLSFPDSPF
ncbi:MAG: hypothetical protein JSV91_02945 [Phycisphaerales bacterium]|nr:MAG: hypothetical protein JSV91_02945 [Phycisphaerales bacterium]